MATNPSDIQLTEAQRSLLADLSEQTGRPWPDLLEELFSRLPRLAPNRPGKANKSLYETLHARGMVGSFEGPTDLSTNPEHMEGFGESPNGKSAD